MVQLLPCCRAACLRMGSRHLVLPHEHNTRTPTARLPSLPPTGKTRCINHFLINGSWYLVDLPGYGWVHRLLRGLLLPPFCCINCPAAAAAALPRVLLLLLLPLVLLQLSCCCCNCPAGAVGDAAVMALCLPRSPATARRTTGENCPAVWPAASRLALAWAMPHQHPLPARLSSPAATHAPARATWSSGTASRANTLRSGRRWSRESH